MENDAPNVFISNEGEMIIINSFELDDEDLDDIMFMESIRDRIQKKYQTKDVYEMMRKNIPRKELLRYLDAVHDLIYYYGIGY